MSYSVMVHGAVVTKANGPLISWVKLR